MGVHTWRRISSHHPSVSQLCINTKLSGDRCCAHSFVHSCVLRLSMFFRVVPQVEPEDAAVWRLWPVVPRGLHTVSNQAITVWRQVCVTAKKKLWIFHIQNVVTINEEFSGWSLVQLTHQQFWHQNSVYGGVLTQTLESDRIFFFEAGINICSPASSQSLLKTWQSARATVQSTAEFQNKILPAPVSRIVILTALVLPNLTSWESLYLNIIPSPTGALKWNVT